ncbi:MAG: RHS repeat-associated core domain-containing protein [Clostridia bacterium]|nr:RHS repeat-associated core domain-containing protein [Clostridia bacterium]
MYDYVSAGNKSSVTSKSDGTSGATAAAYAYLPNHYRMSKTVDGVLTQQIWDGDNVVAEANSANAILRSYTRGHQLLTDDDRRAYMYDGHGNLVQQNRGTAAENVTRYDAYGNKIEKSGTANDTPFGYCGEYLDKESGLIYLRNRYYDSESGRFITEDPIKNGNNWYSYCCGNPVRFEDPLGLQTSRVPLRTTIEDAGGTVNWDDNTKKATVKINGYSRQFYVGDKNETTLENGIMYTNSLILDNLVSPPGASVRYFYNNRASDDVGKFILRTWLDGDGSDQTFMNDYVSDYIYNNQFIQNQIRFLVKTAIDDGTYKINYSSVNSGSNFALTNYGGGYFNGYELINGVNNDVGGLIIKGTVTRNGNGKYTANIYFEFNDIIDPNDDFSRDSYLNEKAHDFGYNCVNFNLKIGGYYTYEYWG